MITFFYKLSLRVKLLLAFIGVSLFIIVGAGSDYLLDLKVSSEYREIALKDLPSLSLAAEMRAVAKDLYTEAFRMAAVDLTPEDLKIESARVTEFISQYEKLGREYASLSTSENERRLFDTVLDKWKAFVLFSQEALNRRLKETPEGRTEFVTLLKGELRESNNAHMKAINDFILFQSQQARLARERAESAEKMGYFVFIIFAFCGCLVTLALGFYAGRYLSRSLLKISSLLFDISSGNHTGSMKLNESAHQASEAASRQAIAIQETLALMGEMTLKISETTKHSDNARALATEISTQSALGTITIEKMASSMQVIASIEGRLKDITKIIDDISARTSIINDIVFKTQLLSVNASIESARAGQHGKGFAVVASEVRSLANLSGKAAKEIRDLLYHSKTQSTKILGDTGQSILMAQTVSQEAIQAFKKISDSISRISERVMQISEANHEQELDVKRISNAMSQINEATSQSSTAAKENAVLSEHLKQHSIELTKVGEQMGFLVAGSHMTQSAIHIAAKKEQDEDETYPQSAA